jgi:hypothetical protein
MDENEDNDSYEKQLSEAISQKRLLQGLIEHSAFKFYVTLLEKQIEKRIHHMLIMPSGMDEMIQKNYASGEIAGLKIAANFPQVMIETLQGTIDMMKFNENELKEK